MGKDESKPWDTNAGKSFAALSRPPAAEPQRPSNMPAPKGCLEDKELARIHIPPDFDVDRALEEGQYDAVDAYHYQNYKKQVRANLNAAKNRLVQQKMDKVQATFSRYFEQSENREESKVTTAALRRQATMKRKFKDPFYPTKAAYITICNDNYEILAATDTGKFKGICNLPAVKDDEVLVREAYTKHKLYKDEAKYQLRNATNQDIADLVKDLLKMIEEDKKTNERTLFFFYYSGHGVLNSAGEVCAVVNPRLVDGKYTGKTESPLENKLKYFCRLPNLYIVALFDCCRDRVKTRGLDRNYSDTDDEDDDSSAIFYYGADAGKGVSAKSNVAESFFRDMYKEIDPLTGTVVLPQDMLTFGGETGNANQSTQCKKNLILPFNAEPGKQWGFEAKIKLSDKKSQLEHKDVKAKDKLEVFIDIKNKIEEDMAKARPGKEILKELIEPNLKTAENQNGCLFQELKRYKLSIFDPEDEESFQDILKEDEQLLHNYSEKQRKTLIEFEDDLATKQQQIAVEFMEIEDILNPTLFIEPEEVKRPEPVTRPKPVIQEFVSRKGNKLLVDGKKTCKIVLVGDTAVGKSCLIENFLSNAFSDDYEPTVLDIQRRPWRINKEMVDLEIHDTSGDEHVASNRKVVFRDADLFILCCNSVQQSSVDNIPKWKAEIREVEQEVPIVLFATKTDLRAIRPSDAVDTKTFKTAKKENDLFGMYETTSKDWQNFNVHKAYQKSIKIALDWAYGVIVDSDSDDD